MQLIDEKFGTLSAGPAYVSLKHEEDKLIVFERSGLLWIFNFNPKNSFANYRIGVDQPGKYRVLFNTDSYHFGGHGRVVEGKSEYFTEIGSWNGRSNYLHVYIPSRSALVLAIESSSSSSSSKEENTNTNNNTNINNNTNTNTNIFPIHQIN